MNNNNGLRAKVREKLAYIFAFTLVGLLASYVVGKVYGFDIEVPAVITTTMGNILIFYFGGESGREKPEG